MEGLWLPKGLGFLAAVTPRSCFAWSQLQTQPIVLFTCVSWCGPCWDTTEPPGCGVGHRWLPCHLVEPSSSSWGWKTSHRAITLHCWGGEGTSAATKDVVHLPPLASSHILGIVPHLAAFCSHLTEMHPFEKIQGLEIACHAMNHCKSSMRKHLCWLTCVLVFMQCIFPYGWNLESEITSQNRIKHLSSEDIPEFERNQWMKPPNSSFHK